MYRRRFIERASIVLKTFTVKSGGRVSFVFVFSDPTTDLHGHERI